MNVAVVDYGAGNVVSVLRALRYAAELSDAAAGSSLNTTRIELTSDASAIAAADAIVFPGQGHFGQASRRLRETGLTSCLRAVTAENRPFLGICLGLQLLFDGSDEAPDEPGLGVFSGQCRRFSGAVKVPQIGWNDVTVHPTDTALDTVVSGTHFYFVHSFAAVSADPKVVAMTANHGGPFTAAVARGRVWATQFHPEKSGDAGISLLQSFLGSAREAT